MYARDELERMASDELFAKAKETGIDPFQSREALIAAILAVPESGGLVTRALGERPIKLAGVIEWIERLALLVLPIWEALQSKKIDAMVDEEELELALKPLRDDIAALESEVVQLKKRLGEESEVDSLIMETVQEMAESAKKKNVTPQAAPAVVEAKPIEVKTLKKKWF